MLVQYLMYIVIYCSCQRTTSSCNFALNSYPQLRYLQYQQRISIISKKWGMKGIYVTVFPSVVFHNTNSWKQYGLLLSLGCHMWQSSPSKPSTGRNFFLKGSPLFYIQKSMHSSLGLFPLISSQADLSENSPFACPIQQDLSESVLLILREVLPIMQSAISSNTYLNSFSLSH